jgi:PAS domain S-box-containing protein
MKYPHKNAFGANKDSHTSLAESGMIEYFMDLHINLHEELLRLEKVKDKDKYIKEIIKKNPLFNSPMINELPGMIYCCRIDDNRTIEFISESCRQITGYKPLDLIMNNKIAYGDIIHPEDRKMVRDHIKKVMGTNQKINLKYRIITAGNKTKWILETGKLLLFPDSDLKLIEGYIRDITAEVEAIDYYKESEESQKLIFKTSPAGIAIVNNRGIISDVSNIVLEFTGLKKNELVGKSFTRLKTLQAKDLPAYINIFTRLLLGKNTRPFTMRWKHKNGSLFTGEVRTSLIKKGKKITGIQVIITDITSRISMENKLKESEEFSRTILNNSITPIYVMDPDTTMKYINPAFEQLTGFSSAEIIGKKPPRPYWIKEMNNIYLSSIEKVLARGVNHIELPLVNKNGNKFWVEVSEKSIKSDGKIKYILGNLIDTTERKEACDRLKKVLDDTINTLSSIVESGDPYTAGHQRRATNLVLKIAKEIKYDDKKIKFLEIAARLYDIGKIGIPASILSKPGILSETEFNMVKTHARIGSDIIKQIDFHYPIAEIILQHHERENGSGYPRGLKGKEIMLEAKIIGVADVAEAMSSHRPYRAALGIKSAIDEITKNKGKLYDPMVADACIKVMSRKNFDFDN